MAVWSIVNFSELTSDLRLDPEYYQPIYLNYINAISGGNFLKTITTIIHPTEIKRVYEDRVSASQTLLTVGF